MGPIFNLDARCTLVCVILSLSKVAYYMYIRITACLKDVGICLISVEAFSRPARQTVRHVVGDLVARRRASAFVTHGRRAPSDSRRHVTNTLHPVVDLEQRLRHVT